MTGELKLVEKLMTHAKTNLQNTHADLMAARPEFEALLAGERPTCCRRRELYRTLGQWGFERAWFLQDGCGKITLKMVCDAAGSEVEIVREFYREWLSVPFDAARVYRRLKRIRNVGARCRICSRPRGKAPWRPRNQGGASGEGVPGSSDPGVAGSDSVGGTEAAGGCPPAPPIYHREDTPTPWLRGLLSELDRGSGDVA